MSRFENLELEKDVLLPLIILVFFLVIKLWAIVSFPVNVGNYFRAKPIVKITDTVSPSVGNDKYVSSRLSRIFHKPDCRFALSISNDDLRILNKTDFAKLGVSACKTCKP